MKISDSILPEFDNEMANTRKTLERCPEDKYGWKPHQKSWPMASLATHLANLPGWATMTLAQDSLDIAPDGNQPQPDAPVKTKDELLAKFDKSSSEARAAIADASDEQLMQPWSLLMTGRTIFTMPRIAVLRGMVFNHIIHHRGQLTVYLRLNDVPVPALYGPSADEGSM
jgi:uncharacterized damage-inducible protein DinB